MSSANATEPTTIITADVVHFFVLRKNNEYLIGILLEILASILVGIGVFLQKVALNQTNKTKDCIPALKGGYAYLKEWLWWCGLFSFGVAEIFDFAAFAFAPIAIVVPLGAFSILVTAILASTFLKENITNSGKLGSLLCVLGSIIIILHSPKEIEFKHLEELFIKFQKTAFIAYVAIAIIAIILIIFWIGPKYGHKYIIVYILVGASVNSFAVITWKALGLTIRDSIEGPSNKFHLITPYILIILSIIFILIQINYMTKALDMFDANIVTPVNYVTLTTLMAIVSMVLFQEWNNMSVEDYVGGTCGILTVVVAVILLNVKKV